MATAAVPTGDVLGKFTTTDGPRQIATWTVSADNALAGRTVADAAECVRVCPLALRPAIETSKVLLDVPADTALQPGDRLIVCGILAIWPACSATTKAIHFSACVGPAGSTVTAGHFGEPSARSIRPS